MVCLNKPSAKELVVEKIWVLKPTSPGKEVKTCSSNILAVIVANSVHVLFFHIWEN